jgi:hypothetical protein
MLALTASCGRKVVIDPSQVPARNDPAWTIRQAPAGPASSASSAIGASAQGASRP